MGCKTGTIWQIGVLTAERAKNVILGRLALRFSEEGEGF